MLSASLYIFTTMTQDSLPTNPPVSRRTHASEAIIKALKKLPRALKLARNKAIEGRNAERAVRTAEHAFDPAAHPDAASDDESLVTVSDIPMDALSPLSKVKKVAEKLSPASARDLFLAFMSNNASTSKRARDDDKPKPATKKLREGSAIPAGMNMPPRFSSYITELYMNNLHLPLSLFTSNNLDLVNNSYKSMATVKHNAPGAVSSDKQIRVLDTASFERKFLAERNMDRGQWLEAAQNFVTFLEGHWSDRDHEQVKCWSLHFGFFAQGEKQETNFPAILATDIKLRRAYNAHPFIYSFDYYSRQLMEEIFALCIAESLPHPPPSLGGPSSGGGGGGNGGGSNGGGGNGIGRGGGAGRSGRGGGDSGNGGTGRGAGPFQGGSGGDTSNVVCLLCARRGHFLSTCTHNTFKDGTPVYCRAEGANNIRAIQSGMTLCRLWNIKCGAASCSHDLTARAHLCSFCGNKNHHAFSWTCRRNPPPTAA
jgi:hypothetical protein